MVSALEICTKVTRAVMEVSEGNNDRNSSAVECTSDQRQLIHGCKAWWTTIDCLVPFGGGGGT